MIRPATKGGAVRVLPVHGSENGTVKRCGEVWEGRGKGDNAPFPSPCSSLLCALVSAQRQRTSRKEPRELFAPPGA